MIQTISYKDEHHLPKWSEIMRTGVDEDDGNVLIKY